MMHSSRPLFFAIFLMAGAAVLYELLLAAVLSYLLGATVLYFSVTIGIFLFALGVGAWFSRRIDENLLQRFLTIEATLAVLGGFAAPFIFGTYALIFHYLGGHVFNNLFSFLFQAGLAEILFSGISFGIIFAIGVLVGVELPLFTRLVSQSLQLKEALARVFFWDYAGSLAGSVLFPLLLLPMLGFLRTGFLIGLLNLAGAAILARSVGQRPVIRSFSRAGAVIAAAGTLALITGFLFAPRLDGLFTRMIFAGGEVIWDETSPYQRIQLVRAGDGNMSLFLNGELQFREGDLEQRYHETFAHPVMAFLGDRARRILVLGGGDGLLLRELWKYPAVASVAMVDIDPAVTRFASTHPLLRELNQGAFNDPRLTLIHDDAFRWLLQRNGPPFDVVFLDLPDPTDDALRRLYSKEFYLLVRRNLAADGMVVTQAGSLPSRFHGVVKESLKSTGYRILSLHPMGPDAVFGIPNVSESSFVAASPSANEIETLFLSLHGNGAAPDERISPYLSSKDMQRVSANSLLNPARSLGASGSMIRHLVETQLAAGNSLQRRIRAPQATVLAQLAKLASGNGPFTGQH